MALGPVMLDIDGTELTPADRDLLVEPAVGGVILFSRNYESVEQIRKLVADIRALRNPPLLVAVDHEGGRVQRFREGFTHIPTMRSIGVMLRQDEKRAHAMARTCGWLIGAELGACRIDLSFAPCVDLDWGVSDIIGDRSFHRKPDIVAELAQSFCHGMQSAGMAAAAKHFPGHGAVVADSHVDLPVDRREYSAILDDILPYERLISNRAIAGVMTAHVVYEEIDRAPATFSRAWIANELRGRLGFDGAIFSDDLSMHATRVVGGMRDRARLALEAGCDMLLVCNDRPAAERVVGALRNHRDAASLVRLARLRGTPKLPANQLESSADWQAAHQAVLDWQAKPTLELNG